MKSGRKPWNLLAALAAGIFVLSCCSAVDMASFRAAGLAQQIEMYRHMYAMNCLGQQSTRYLIAIGEHGVPAAEAMIPMLDRRDDTFPPGNALLVIVTADAKTSLHGHPVEAALERFIQTAERKDDRNFAIQVLGAIRDEDREPAAVKPGAKAYAAGADE